MVLDARAEPKHDEDAVSAEDLDERQDVMTRTDEEIAVASRQFTMAGIVSTKQRRLEDELAADSAPPGSFTSNSTKELLCLEYVAGFQRQFERMFPQRRSLYLLPPNECGRAKFVCTTIRPTLLPFRDLYDYQPMARFLAGLITYEPLADPRAPPKCLPSPSFTLKWRAGDSYDFSVLLVSFLIGAGYDAFVVHGLAPRWICLLDQSKTPLPVLPVEELLKKQKELTPEQARLAAAAAQSSGDSIKLESRSTFTSKYLTMQQERILKETQAKEKRLLDSVYDEEEDDDDPLEGKRMHAWVLVRAGKRDVAEHFFLEATTGLRYPLRDCPYAQIESVWNHENYWVNMQPHPVDMMLFDLSNATDWEYVFLSAAERRSAKDAEGDAKGDLSDGLKSLSASENGSPNNQDDDQDLILDVPPSWVSKLHIDRASYKKKFVTDSQRVTIYRRAKLEEFAENSHDQGLIVRVTLYRDNSYTLPVEIREFFKNRKDKLEMRKRFPLESKFEEHFAPGRLPEALKARIEWIGHRRELQFYASARMDGLLKREEFIQKRTLEHFEGRDDFLVFRSVTMTNDKDEVDSKNPYVLPGGSTGELAIKKMKEKFARNPALPADEDARKKTYNVQEGNIRVNFQYATGKITAGARTYYKAASMPVDVVMADPNAPKPKLSVLEDELRASLQVQERKEEAWLMDARARKTHVLLLLFCRWRRTATARCGIPRSRRRTFSRSASARRWPSCWRPASSMPTTTRPRPTSATRPRRAARM